MMLPPLGPLGLHTNRSPNQATDQKTTSNAQRNLYATRMRCKWIRSGVYGCGCGCGRGCGCGYEYACVRSSPVRPPEPTRYYQRRAPSSSLPRASQMLPYINPKHTKRPRVSRRANNSRLLPRVRIRPQDRPPRAPSAALHPIRLGGVRPRLRARVPLHAQRPRDPNR